MGEGGFALRRCRRGGNREKQGGDLQFMGIANDEGDAREGGDFFGGALGVATGDDDASGRVRGVDFADGVAGLGIGSGGDGAGVEHDHVGSVGLCGRGAALFAQLTFNGGAIGLGGATAELLDVERGHEGCNQDSI